MCHRLRAEMPATGRRPDTPAKAGKMRAVLATAWVFYPAAALLSLQKEFTKSSHESQGSPCEC